MYAPLHIAAALGAALTALAMIPAALASDMARIERADVQYRVPGEFLDNGLPVNAPLIRAHAEYPFDIMKRQVTRGEYERCAAAGACKPLDGAGAAELPVTGVSWDDASAYAAWLSQDTGQAWRLPTDREWALAAGSRYRDDVSTEISDRANPSRRWLAVYDAETARQQGADGKVHPAGTFGANENRIDDLAGNVWEWTSTCYVRHRRDAAERAPTEVENCGVRIAQGRHRAYMTGFFRDPKGGACSVGVPPAHLGIRLVRDLPGRIERLRKWLIG